MGNVQFPSFSLKWFHMVLLRYFLLKLLASSLRSRKERPQEICTAQGTAWFWEYTAQGLEAGTQELTISFRIGSRSLQGIFQGLEIGMNRILINIFTREVIKTPLNICEWPESSQLFFWSCNFNVTQFPCRTTWTFFCFIVVTNTKVWINSFSVFFFKVRNWKYLEFI
jgi:hypothetical protein